MGKGKGKLAGWSSELPAGILILEFKNLRSGRAIYFCKQIMHKLPAKSKIIFRSKVRTSLLLSSSTKISYDVIW
jgi:ribosomal protein L16/L10AE